MRKKYNETVKKYNETEEVSNSIVYIHYTCIIYLWKEYTCYQ